MVRLLQKAQLALAGVDESSIFRMRATLKVAPAQRPLYSRVQLYERFNFDVGKLSTGSSRLSDETVEGYLFLCSNRTQKECFQKKLFGSTREKWGWVEEIKMGTPLFLYNVDSKTFFGPFRAASEGKWNIDPAAWENVRPLIFPAQVSVDWDELHEINVVRRKWKFLRHRVRSLCKLTKDQTNDLLDALQEAPLYNPNLK